MMFVHRMGDVLFGSVGLLGHRFLLSVAIPGRVRDLADALCKTFREADTIARLGGDEFTVLAMAAPGVDSELLAHRLQRHLDAQNASGRRLYDLSLSVGVIPFDAATPEPIADLLARADALMYESKRRKRCVRASQPAETQVLRELIG
jgi:diguanylate cyclase (GGDEF)-like protein